LRSAKGKTQRVVDYLACHTIATMGGLLRDLKLKSSELSTILSKLEGEGKVGKLKRKDGTTIFYLKSYEDKVRRIFK